MGRISNVFSLAIEGAAINALNAFRSSTLQLLHWVPAQRIWNKVVNLVFALPWRLCRQASPQKHACNSRLFAKKPMMRNWIKNSLNIFIFLDKFFSILSSIKKVTRSPQLLSFYSTSVNGTPATPYSIKTLYLLNIVALSHFNISRFATINLLSESLTVNNFAQMLQ